MTTEDPVQHPINPDKLIVKIGLDNKSKRLLERGLEGMSKAEKLQVLKEQFPGLFETNKLATSVVKEP